MTPCIKVCKLDSNKEYCIGCFRTKKEIGAWAKLSYDKKLQIMSDCENRKHTKGDLCQQK